MRVLLCPSAGAKLRGDRDAVDLIGEARGNRASLVLVPAERFDPDFFRLKTGLAGQFLQKFVIYRVRLAIVGDISAFANESSSLCDLVSESNQGSDIWFVRDLKELADRIQRAS